MLSRRFPGALALEGAPKLTGTAASPVGQLAPLFKFLDTALGFITKAE
jgi:hypothetical protein